MQIALPEKFGLEEAVDMSQYRLRTNSRYSQKLWISFLRLGSVISSAHNT